jgi:hypothetical protein
LEISFAGQSLDLVTTPQKFADILAKSCCGTYPTSLKPYSPTTPKLEIRYSTDKRAISCFGNSPPWQQDKYISAHKVDEHKVVLISNEGYLTLTTENGNVEGSCWSDKEGEWAILGAYGITRALAYCGAGMLHAGALEYEGKTTLILGVSGAGKSTMTMLALANGGRIVSDDLIAIHATHEDSYFASPFRRNAQLRQQTVNALPIELQQALVPIKTLAGMNRSLLQRDHLPEAFSPGGRISQIFLLESQSKFTETTQIAHASPAQCLATLYSATSPIYLTAPFTHERKLLSNLFSGMASQIPTWQITPGKDLMGPNASSQIHSLLTPTG